MGKVFSKHLRLTLNALRRHRENQENFHVKPGQKICIEVLTINNMTFWEFFLLFLFFLFFFPSFFGHPCCCHHQGRGNTHNHLWLSSWRTREFRPKSLRLWLVFLLPPLKKNHPRKRCYSSAWTTLQTHSLSTCSCTSATDRRYWEINAGQGNGQDHRLTPFLEEATVNQDLHVWDLIISMWMSNYRHVNFLWGILVLILNLLWD